jgi:hypothetical protein
MLICELIIKPIIMNKFLTLAFVLILSSSAFAQTGRNGMNKEYGRQYEEIRKNPNLSEYEKGQKKRELSLQQKKDNMNYGNHHEHPYGNHSEIADKKKKDIDNQIDQLEERYKRDKEKIENNNRLSKNEIKIQKNELERTYKYKKNALEREKKAIKK